MLKRKVLLSTQNICIEWRHVLKIITLGIKYTIVLLLLTGTTKNERLKPILSHVIRLRGNLIILIAKYCIFASKYKMQRPTFMGFLKTLHQRKEAERLRIGMVLSFAFFCLIDLFRYKRSTIYNSNYNKNDKQHKKFLQLSLKIDPNPLIL